MAVMDQGKCISVAGVENETGVCTLRPKAQGTWSIDIEINICVADSSKPLMVSLKT
jgi:hypothetical protein